MGNRPSIPALRPHPAVPTWIVLFRIFWDENRMERLYSLGVDFSYIPGEPVLRQASFTVPDQKLTAIVGDSCSDKSTILNLIAKYYEVSGAKYNSY